MAAVLAVSTPVEIPPLEAGDFLSREEFERRYEAMPGVKKAELIEGIVYMPSPVRFDKHAEPHSWLITWGGLYVEATAGIQSGSDATVRLDDANEPQPDLILRIRPDWGGKSRNEEGYIAGPPEFAAEVAASSASYDRHQKKRAYERAGVQEYLIWVIRDQSVEWWQRVDGRYELLPVDPDGIIRSRQFPGLWLNTAAVQNQSLSLLLGTLRDGIASPEHADFARLLASRNPA